MARQRKKNRKTSGEGRRVESASRILAGYRSFLVRQGVDQELQFMEPLLELKKTYLDRPEPTVWTEELLAELLMGVAPRHMLIMEEERDALLPDIQRFLEFLRDSGRWSPDSFDSAEIEAVIAWLERPALQAVADSVQRGFASNLISFAISQGVDLNDEVQMQDFISVGEPGSGRIRRGRLHPGAAR